LISTSDSHVSSGVKQVEESGKALAEIAGYVEKICTQMVSAANAQEEQAAALRDVDAAIGQMDRSTQENAAMAEESHAASEALAGFAHALAETVGRFTIGQTSSPPTGKRRTAASSAPRSLRLVYEH
jgi:methyl-accepting chemotaxis protein